MLLTVPDVSLAPEAQGQSWQSESKTLSSYFDGTLQNGGVGIPSLSTLETTDSIHVRVLKTFPLFDNIVAHPLDYGFTDVIDPCYTGTLEGFADTTDPGTVCANPDQYLFWDQLHLTAAGNAVIANAAFNALYVPEPSSMLLLAAGLLGLFVCSRRALGLSHRNCRAFTPPAAIQDSAQAGRVP